METKEILIRAAAAKNEVKALSTDEKNRALNIMAAFLKENTEVILRENAKDVENARGKIAPVMLDRLLLTKERIDSMARGMLEVMALPDPCGRVIERIERENGLIIEKTAIPMGVIGIIYESRPNVTSDAASLCFKSGNACVLRGGKEAYNTSKAIVNALKKGLIECKINPDAIGIIDDTTRESANEMMRAKGLIDLLIPRGGKGLIKAVTENATVPCIETGTGICHIYVEKTASFDMALNIIDNAKTSRPSVCNACEVVLLDREIAPEFLPLLYERLTQGREHPVKFVLDKSVKGIIEGENANDESFDTEYLDYILAVKAVEGVKEATEHIALHSTHHSEAIVTKSEEAKRYFLNNVDSSSVYVNASTRFTDGGEFGLGCEMGISTQKLHARGPMGLNEMETYQYRVTGSGQCR